MAVLKIKDALGNVYPVSAIQGTGIQSAAVAESGGSYHLMLTLTDGTELDAGVLPAAEPVGAHTHGNVTYDGKIGSEAGHLVETGANGTVQAGRRIVAGTEDPRNVSGLSAGDIYLWYEA